MTGARKLSVIYDTDIGSDVDDALTLAMLLGSPEVDLLAVTTVYGDTRLRARIASRLISLAAGHVTVPVVPGTTTTLAGRPVWWAGHEGSTMDHLEDEPVHDQDITEFLTRRAREVADLHIIGTAPLTNLARAVNADHAFSTRVAGLTIMGGMFGPVGSNRPEHNFACDPEAADIVATCGIPLVVTGLEITRQLQITPRDVDRIMAAGPLGVALGREIAQWWSFTGEQRNVPHDPVAALTLIAPELFTFEPADLRVSVSDEPGTSRATPAPSARSRIVTAVQAEAATDAIVERIVRASTLGNATA